MEQMMNIEIQDSVNINHLYFKVTNHGGYVAHYTVQYKIGGQAMTIDSGVFSLGMENKAFIPENATDLILTTSISMGIHWRVVDIKSFATMQTACFVLHGTLFNPKLTKVDCTTGNIVGGNGDIPLIPVVPPCCHCCNPCQSTSMMEYQDYMGMSYEQYLAYMNSMNGMNNMY